MLNLGDFTTSDTIYVPFATYDSNGASVTITGLAVTDIEIYKDGSVTQRSSDSGYTLLDTDGIDFDGVTGIHGFSVDLSDNTDVGFYADGSQYWLVVSAITVDSQTVNFVYYFSIGRYLKPTTAGRTLNVAADGDIGGNVDGNVVGSVGSISGVTFPTNFADLSITNTTGRIDVGSWLGTAVTTSSTSAKPEVDMFSISDDATAANNAESDYDGTGYDKSNSTIGTCTTNTDMRGTDSAVTVLVSGTADSGTTTTMVDAARTEADTNYWVGHIIRFTSGTISGQCRLITGFTPGTDTITFYPGTTQSVGTNTYEILPFSWVKVQEMDDDTITAAAMADGCIDSAVIANDAIHSGTIATGAITAAKFASGAIDAAALATDAVNEIADGVWDEATAGHVTAGTYGVAVTDVLADTSTTLPASLTAIETDTQDLQTQIGTAGAGLTDLGGMSTAMKAEVNAEVDTALITTTYAEPGQGTPGATISIKDKIGYLYKAWRNKSDQDSTTYQLYNDDASTVDQKATVSDATGVATKGEVTTGP